MVKIVVLASFNMDLVMRAERMPAPGETLQGEFAMHLGGKGFNQALAARRLGADVAVIGRVGDDEFGRRFLDALDREGIDRAHVSVDPHEGTGVAAIVVDERGENAIVQAPRANRLTKAEDIRTATVVDIVKCADVAVAQLETSDEALEAFISLATEVGTRAVLNTAPARFVARQILGMTHVVVANELEIAALTGAATHKTKDDALQNASELASEIDSTVVVTRGECGAVAAARGGDAIATDACAVSAVDTVGAGDAFCAAFAVALAEGRALHDAMRFANAAGALATTKHGAEPSMPYRDDVEELMATGRTR
jgi:ribokinase